jgi:hypothetical protein
MNPTSTRALAHPPLQALRAGISIVRQLLRDVNVRVAQIDQGRFSAYKDDSLEQFFDDVRVVKQTSFKKKSAS